MKCECRYNCLPRHRSAIVSGRPRRGEWTDVCTNFVADGYLRFECPFNCGAFLIMNLCSACYERCEKWLGTNARVTCEGCFKKTTTKECWSLYKDTK